MTIESPSVTLAVPVPFDDVPTFGAGVLTAILLTAGLAVLPTRSGSSVGELRVT